MSDWRGAVAVLVVIIAVMLVSVWGASNLCGNKGGHLTLSLLSSPGYACVDASDRVIPLP